MAGCYILLYSGSPAKIWLIVAGFRAYRGSKNYVNSFKEVP